MAQDKEEKKTEDETYKAEAAHRLELAKADEKRIREEIEALKKEIEKAKEAREGKVIDIQWAEEELADCRLLEEIAGRKKERLERIISSDSREELPDLIGFSPKQRVYADKDGKGSNDGKKEDKGKKEEKKPEEKGRLRPSPEAAAAAMTAAGVASALKRSENTNLKEVARGVSAVSAIQAERSSRAQINGRGKGLRLAGAGLSRAAEKRLIKEERRQERAFKKLQKENEKGVTAFRTESRFVTKDGEKADKNKSMPPKTAGEDKKKSDELRRAELERKIEKLREKLETLQRRRIRQAGKVADGSANEVRFSAEEAKALPSVKAGRAMEEAYKAKELPAAEKGGAVNEASLTKMEHTAAKAEESLKTATLVPDYATPEFKRKAAEQGIDPNKGKSREEKKTDRQKLLALSGRPGTGEAFRNEEKPATEDRQGERPELRIDPEKSRAASAEKSGKEINMQQYRLTKELQGGRQAG